MIAASVFLVLPAAEESLRPVVATPARAAADLLALGGKGQSRLLFAEGRHIDWGPRRLGLNRAVYLIREIDPQEIQ